MTVPSVSWAENSPAGSDNISLGDNRIREMKTQIREVIDVDHQFNSTGQDADNGKHNQVSLLEAEDIGTGATGKPILGAQTIAGVPELVYTTEDDTDIQITKAGVLKPSTSTVLADWSAIMNLVYPVGSVVTLGVSTNPATLYGVGTWTAIAGKVIVGIDGTQTEFDALNETGGVKTHDHTYSGTVSGLTRTTSIASSYDTTTNQDDHTHTYSGTTVASSNLMPYIVKYCWERTS